MTVLYNRGQRTWTLKDGKDKEGNPVKRLLKPNESIEALDAAEAEHMLSYNREIIDAGTMVKGSGDKEKIQALTEERDALLARVAELEALLPEEKDDKGKGSKKK